jgi:two-component sensor histidine kinase
MKKFITFLLFVSTMLPGWPQVNTADPNQLFTQLARSKPDTVRIRIYIDLAEYYFNRMRLRNRMDSVKLYLRNAEQLNASFNVASFKNKINLLYARREYALNPSQDPKTIFLPLIDTCKKYGDKKNEALIWAELGFIGNTDSLSLAFKSTCIQNGLALARQLGDNYTEVRLLRYMSIIHWIQRKYDLAEDEMFKILKDEKKAGPSNIMFAYDQLAAIYNFTGKPDKQLLYALKSVQMMGITRDSTYAALFYDRVASAYKTLERHIESLQWSKISVEYKLATENASGGFDNIDMIALQLLDQGRAREALDFLLQQMKKQKSKNIFAPKQLQRILGKAYEKLKMYDLAEKSFLTMINLGKQLGDKLPNHESGYDNLNIGAFYYNRGQFKKALTYFEEGLRNYEEYGLMPTNIRAAHLWLYKTDSALGDYLGSLRHLKESNRLSDLLFAVDKNKQLEELAVAYNTTQKNDSIRLLQEHEKIAGLQLQHSKSIRNWITAGAAMLVLIASLLYRQGRIRKKNNRIINTKNGQLQHLVTEKEWLLKEIHHRVKNNLQIVMSLLNSQSAYIDNEPALTAIHDSQHRVHAMSLIHQKLYSTENVSSIDMSFYIRELVSYLADSFETGQRIRFELHLEPLELDVSQAVPLGLILNEAITNSIKYAFPDVRNGVISVALSNTDSHHYLLIISDNGIGMPNDFTAKKGGSLGMSLMAGLSEDLDGNFLIENNNGTLIKISFVRDTNAKRMDRLTASLITNN